MGWHSSKGTGGELAMMLSTDNSDILSWKGSPSNLFDLSYLRVELRTGPTFSWEV